MPGTRVDSGVGTGDTIGTDYDAMVAKLIAWASTREEALRRLAASLERAEIHGVGTNRDLLVALLRHPAVVEARMDTTWLDGAGSELVGSEVDQAAAELSAFAATVALTEARRAAATVQQRIPSGFRNVVADALRTTFTDTAGGDVVIRWYGGRHFRWADHDDVTVQSVSVPDAPEEPTTVTLSEAGVDQRFRVFVAGESVDVESPRGHVALRLLPRFTDPADQVAAGSMLAPMPGRVTEVRVVVGDSVDEGQTLVVMEAMKMQHTIAAPTAGTVTEMAAVVGEQVEAGAVLAVVSPPSTPDPVADPTA